MHKAITSTRTYVHCPNCGEQAGRIDHLFAYDREIKTRWTCDHCGTPYDLTVSGPDDVKVVISPDEGMAVPCLHVLVLKPRATPVYVVIEAKDYNRKDGRYEGAQYFYDEHTCPTNWTDQIQMLITDGDGDPHGLFEYVESVDLPANLPNDDVDEFIRSAFPHLFEEASENPAIERKQIGGATSP